MMKKYCIGDVDQSTVPLDHTTNPTIDYSYRAEGRGLGSSGKLFQFLVPFVIVGLAFIIKIYTKQTSAWWVKNHMFIQLQLGVCPTIYISDMYF